MTIERGALENIRESLQVTEGKVSELQHKGGPIPDSLHDEHAKLKRLLSYGISRERVAAVLNSFFREH